MHLLILSICILGAFFSQGKCQAADRQKDHLPPSLELLLTHKGKNYPPTRAYHGAGNPKTIPLGDRTRLAIHSWYWPERKATTSDAPGVIWVGDLTALFQSEDGHYYEDTNHNKRLDLSGENFDRQVFFYFDRKLQETRGCYDPIEVWDENLGCFDDAGFSDINFLFSASNWLDKIPKGVDDPLAISNRPYGESGHQRYIFTWNDLNNNGRIDYPPGMDRGEVFSFAPGAKDWTKALDPTPLGTFLENHRAPLAVDFNIAPMENEAIDQLICWIRGVEGMPGFRNRSQTKDNGEVVSYKMADIMGGTPLVVGPPAARYDLLYRDPGYARFYKAYKKRRTMVYVGANDGMLHAFNAGFTTEGTQICRAPADSLLCPSPSSSSHELGAELWAYIPYNLIPHLAYLASPDYHHRFFLDFPPKAFDVQIFFKDDGTTPINDARYPDGWGTILVGGMGLGPGQLDAASDLAAGHKADGRRFISSFFILDITDPEVPPTLLGEFTQLVDEKAVPIYYDLGTASTAPELILMKEKAQGQPGDKEANLSYLVFGNGKPSSAIKKAKNAGQPRLAIVPLNSLVANQYGFLADNQAASTTATEPPMPLRFDRRDLVGSPLAGSLALTDAKDGYIVNFLAIDFDLGHDNRGAKTDVLYLTTVAEDGSQIMRLVSRKMGGDEPFAFTGDARQELTTPKDWQFKPFFTPRLQKTEEVEGKKAEVGQLITGKPILGYDGMSFWLYLGTGALDSVDDAWDQSQQSYYGLKEPMEYYQEAKNGKLHSRFLFSELDYQPISYDQPGYRGLLKVDDILLKKDSFGRSNQGHLLCRSRDFQTSSEIDAAADLWCLPGPLRLAGSSGEEAYFSHSTQPNLKDYIRDHPQSAHLLDGCSKYKKGCVDGWYRDFRPYGNGERLLEGSQLRGGMLSFFSHKPDLDGDQPFTRFFYGLHYQTGTSWLRESTQSGLIDPRLKITFEKTETKTKMQQTLAMTSSLDQGEQEPELLLRSLDGRVETIEIEPLPESNYRSGRIYWREIREGLDH